MERLNNISDLGLIIKYAFRDLVRNYKKMQAGHEKGERATARSPDKGKEASAS